MKMDSIVQAAPEEQMLIDAISTFLAAVEFGFVEDALDFIAAEFLIVQDVPRSVERGASHALRWMRSLSDAGIRPEYDHVSWLGGRVRRGDTAALILVDFSRDALEPDASERGAASALIQMTREREGWRVGGIEWRPGCCDPERGRLH